MITQVQSNVKWSEHKKANERTIQKLHLLGKHRRATRMRNCASFMDVYLCPCCGKVKVKSANYCKDRLCAVCNWRLSLQRYVQMRQIMDYIKSHDDSLHYTFLTLTVKNCKPETLSETLQNMADGWKRLIQRKFFKDRIIGWARSLEITYNKYSRELHPHYHIILISKDKLDIGYTERQLKHMWQDCMRLSYEPIIDLREIHSHTGTEDEALSKSILETYKYVVKSKHLDDMPLGVFKEFSEQLSGKRLLAFGGIIKEAKALLRLDMEELQDGELKDITCHNCNRDMQLAVAQWCWDTQTYEYLIKIDSERQVS